MGEKRKKRWGKKNITENSLSLELAIEREDVGFGPANRSIEAMRAAEGVRGEGSVPQSHGDLSRGEQRSESRRPRYCKNALSKTLVLPFCSCFGRYPCLFFSLAYLAVRVLFSSGPCPILS